MVQLMNSDQDWMIPTANGIAARNEWSQSNGRSIIRLLFNNTHIIVPSIANINKHIPKRSL